MNASITIRAATEKDSATFARLLGQLGYPVSAANVARRVERLAGLPSEKVLVAERHGQVIGVISVHMTVLLHAADLGRITALVVDQTARRQGIGTKLMKAAERWAWSQNCSGIELTSGDQRGGAHRFYAACGYHFTGKRFLKDRPGS